MHLNLVNAQTLQRMRELQLLLGLRQEIVGHTTKKIPDWLVVWNRDLDILRHIKPCLLPLVINDSFYALTGIKHIIDNQNTGMMTNVLNHVIH